MFIWMIKSMRGITFLVRRRDSMMATAFKDDEREGRRKVVASDEHLEVLFDSDSNMTSPS